MYILIPLNPCGSLNGTLLYCFTFHFSLIVTFAYLIIKRIYDMETGNKLLVLKFMALLNILDCFDNIDLKNY